ncbi:MAG TPA: hypothetical protein VHP31_12225 [Caproicibacter sp.]|nr:hypothetical protein [Caproicibacter sp.]
MKEIITNTKIGEAIETIGILAFTFAMVYFTKNCQMLWLLLLLATVL